jgi:hypothetical protein
MPRKPAKPSTYVRVARALARKTPDHVISAGQVAWHARRPAGNLDNLDMAVDRTLSESGLFERASWLNGGRLSEITLWRGKSAGAGAR